MGLFSKFVIGKTKPALHSSGMAGNGTMGATSPQSYSRRKQIDKHRKHVGKYRDASVVHGYRSAANAVKKPQAPAAPEKHGAAPNPASPPPRAHRHDPYAR